MATTVTRPVMLDSTGRELVDVLANVTISPTNIINNVTSYDTDKALAANQGRILDQSSTLRVNTLKTETVGSVSAFSTSSVYAVGAYVTYNDLLYRCKKAVTTAGAWNAANWELVNLQELKTNIESAKRNIGELVFSSVPLTDAGLKLADGSIIASNGAYADFYNYIVSLYNASSPAVIAGTAADTGKYVYDSANSRIFLPNLNNLFIEGTTTANDLGKFMSAGLPNITGTANTVLGNEASNFSDFSGAFYGYSSKSYANTTGQSSGYTRYSGFSFDASRGASTSGIYGNSSTVQPPAVKQYIYIVVANVVKTDYTVNIDNVMADVNALNGAIADVNSDMNALSNRITNLDERLLTEYFEISQAGWWRIAETNSPGSFILSSCVGYNTGDPGVFTASASVAYSHCGISIMSKSASSGYYSFSKIRLVSNGSGWWYVDLYCDSVHDTYKNTAYLTIFKSDYHASLKLINPAITSASGGTVVSVW